MSRATMPRVGDAAREMIQALRSLNGESSTMRLAIRAGVSVADTAKQMEILERRGFATSTLSLDGLERFWTLTARAPR